MIAVAYPAIRSSSQTRSSSTERVLVMCRSASSARRVSATAAWTRFVRAELAPSFRKMAAGGVASTTGGLREPGDHLFGRGGGGGADEVEQLALGVQERGLVTAVGG